MTAMATEAVNVLLAGSLAIAPGLLLVAVLARVIPIRLRVLAAFVLSPGLLSLELPIAILVGLDFKQFSYLASLLNLFLAIILIFYCRPRLSPRGIGYPALLACALTIPIMVIVLSQTFRTDYGWHNMMQVAAIQQLNRLPQLPEEFEMAGFRLNYGWVGWAQLGAISNLIQISPTRLFLPVNILHFISMFVLLVECSVLSLGRRHAPLIIAASTAVALLAAGLPDIILGIFRREYHALGDARITPMIEKIQNLDTMVFGLSSFALMVFAVSAYLEFKRLSFLILATLSSLASCLVYPLFLPSCMAVFAALIAYEILQQIRGVKSFDRRALIRICLINLLWIASFGMVILYGLFLGRDSEVPPFSVMQLRDFPLQFVRWGWIYCAIDAILLSTVIFRRKSLSWSQSFFIVVSFDLQFAYVVIAVRDGVGYKFLFTALLFAAPVVAAEISRWADIGSRSFVLAGVLIVLFLSCVVYEFPRWTDPDLRFAIPVNIYTLEVAPEPNEMPSWLQVVREKAPPDAVLFTAPDERPLAVFSGRALYVCGDVPVPTSRAGYSMNCTRELTSVKGYSPKKVADRMELLTLALKKEISEAEAETLMKAFRALDRPMIFHTSGFSGFTRWLREKELGRPIFVSETDVVWSVDKARAGSGPTDSSASYSHGPT